MVVYILLSISKLSFNNISKNYFTKVCNCTNNIESETASHHVTLHQVTKYRHKAGAEFSDANLATKWQHLCYIKKKLDQA